MGRTLPDYRTCSQGKTQSPIDIKGAQSEELSPIDFSYFGIKTAKVLNNGHTLQVNYANGSMISINGKEYDLVQFHFHAPSEHTIDGKPADMELHFVHKNGDGKLAVVGVLMKKGAENETIAKLWANLPKKPMTPLTSKQPSTHPTFSPLKRVTSTTPALLRPRHAAKGLTGLS